MTTRTRTVYVHAWNADASAVLTLQSCTAQSVTDKLFQPALTLPSAAVRAQTTPAHAVIDALKAMLPRLSIEGLDKNAKFFQCNYWPDGTCHLHAAISLNAAQAAQLMDLCSYAEEDHYVRWCEGVTAQMYLPPAQQVYVHAGRVFLHYPKLDLPMIEEEMTPQSSDKKK